MGVDIWGGHGLRMSTSNVIAEISSAADRCLLT